MPSSTASAPVDVERVDRFERVPPGDWPADPRSTVFLTAEWTRSVEGALAREQAYVLGRDGDGGSVGTMGVYVVGPDTGRYFNPAALLTFHLGNPELVEHLRPDERGEAAELAATLRPEDLAPAAVATAPFAFVHSLSSTGGRAVAERLVAELEEIGREAGAASLAVLYVEEDEHELRDVLRRAGFAEALVAANAVLPIEWDSFDGYLGSLSRSRRAKVKREVKRFRESGIEVAHGSILENLDRLAHLQALLQEKHGAGYDLERERGAFLSVTTHIHPYARLLVARRDGDLVGFILYFEKEGLVHPKMGARDLSRVTEADALHFYLGYYAIVEQAIAGGAREIQYGLDAYGTKVFRGCVLRDLYWYVKAASPSLAVAADIVSRGRRRYLDAYRALSPRR